MISLEQYLDLENRNTSIWTAEADVVEKEIDKLLHESIERNIIPNIKNPNFILRYKFKNTVSPAAKDILRVRYGNSGWVIKENLEMKESFYDGFFDFYKRA